MTAMAKDIRHISWFWMAAAFCASLGLALGAVVVFHTPHMGRLGIALQTSARVAFLFFWPAYVGGALTSLFGDVFLPLKKHARELGLAFAAALVVHLGFVLCLYVIGPAPSTRTLIVFGPAAALTYLLAIFSVGAVRQALPRKLWPPVRLVAMNYIALVFVLDFAQFRSYDFGEGLKYMPFAALAIVGPALKLAAWAQNNVKYVFVRLGGASRP